MKIVIEINDWQNIPVKEDARRAEIKQRIVDAAVYAAEATADRCRVVIKSDFDYE